MTYEGRVYQVKSGQWAWEVTRGGEPIVCGAGYETEDEAWSDMYCALSHYEDSCMKDSPSHHRLVGTVAMSADDIECPLSEQDIDDIVLLGGYHNAVGGIYANSVYDFARDVAIAAIQADRASRDERLRAACEELLNALRQIAEWPDGGNRYGQENVKRFAKAAIDAAMENSHEGR